MIEFHVKLVNVLCLFLIQMGDPSVEVTEEKRDAAQLEKLKAMDAISKGILHLLNSRCFFYLFISFQILSFFPSSGKLDEAIDYLTEAIMLNSTSAILYATRGNFICNIVYPFLQNIYSLLNF